MSSRREFLAQTAAATAAIMLPLDVRQLPRPACTLVDFGDHCALRESLLGYRRELSERGLTLTNADDDPAAMIIPGAAHIDSSTARLVAGCLQRGGTVLLESGAAFADFGVHRDAMRDYFQIHLDPPIDLWPARGIPYVDYIWPRPAKIRDFSRVIPVASRVEQIVGRVADIPVALARRAGQGTLIFLGSPLGPALWAGDADARRWLGSVLSLSAID